MGEKTPTTVIIIGLVLILVFIAVTIAYIIAFSGNPSSDDNINITIENKTLENIDLTICNKIKYMLKSNEHINIEATKGIIFNINGYINDDISPTFKGDIIIANDNYRGNREIRINSINAIYKIDEWNEEENIINKYRCETKDGYNMEINTKCGTQTQNKKLNGEKHQNFFSCKNINSFVINFFPPLK